MRAKFSGSWSGWHAGVMATVVVCIAGAGRIASAAEAVAVAGSTTNAPKAEFVIPKSVFVDDPTGKGKDPFFPNSTRRLPKPPPVQGAPISSNTVANPVTPVVPPKDPVDSLALKGITGSRRLALINGQPFGVGEEYVVRTGAGSVKVKCVEIRERSVLVTVEGKTERIELKLPDNP